MLNTIIIEDEKAARQNLINALMNIDANLNVAAELSSVRESIEYFSSGTGSRSYLLRCATGGRVII